MDIFEAIRTRRSVRQYSPRAIPDKVMRKMRLALRCAPSACNHQPWRFIFVTGPELRQELAQAANEQLWMADAPVVVVACAFADQAFDAMGGYGNSADMDVTIALDHLTLAAVAEGLGTCWIGAFREGKVKKLLEVPRKVKVVAMTPLGYPASADLNYPLDEGDRKLPAEIFDDERFGRSSSTG